jgi:hypothetical protein
MSSIISLEVGFPGDRHSHCSRAKELAEVRQWTDQGLGVNYACQKEMNHAYQIQDGNDGDQEPDCDRFPGGDSFAALGVGSGPILWARRFILIHAR